MPLRLGYLLPTRDAIAGGRPEPGPLIELACRAEQAGFDAVWAGDSPLARPRHEPLVLLAAAAERTSRVSLGTAVLLAPLRHPLSLAHEAATLDRISGGRLVLGMGSGFPLPQTEAQFAAFGIPYRSRVSRLEEIVEVLRLIWARPGEQVSFEGRHFRFAGVRFEPAPGRPGGPPIWLAGGGPQAYRRAGRIADGWLPYSPSPAQYRLGRDEVRRSAADHGRQQPKAALYVTAALDGRRRSDAEQRLRQSVERYYEFPLEQVRRVQAMYAGDAEGFIEMLAPYLAAGVDQLVLRLADDQPERALDVAATELVPLLRTGHWSRAA